MEGVGGDATLVVADFPTLSRRKYVTRFPRRDQIPSRPPGRTAEMRTAALLDAAGIPSRRRSTGMVRPRPALLVAAGLDLAATG
ncbi:hypothetical protein GCM10009555_043350 [Acrocarpospora macrocephala]|uniref:Uncharacterized protein n=1 Tax=Acrocarpospora macrocephala TaxID=150177 RepID=A0A5M3WFY5_9ACTN|nr:hypothetical protein Amac_005970 [Acrocarpospora macrocephala]